MFILLVLQVQVVEYTEYQHTTDPALHVKCFQYLLVMAAIVCPAQPLKPKQQVWRCISCEAPRES